ncbi:MAG: glycosyltransferase [Lachnospiraceae bacterium]|nr:glycosyltransferase [Lachnospiraceae bacterium]
MVSKDYICTFILPVYLKNENKNGLKYFKETINSIINQTNPHWSLVVIDDNSDNCFLDKYISELINKEQNEIIYHQNVTNMGAGASRNTGIDIAVKKLGSDIILFQDADDLAHPRRVEVTKEAFESMNIDLVYSPFLPIDSSGKEIKFDNLTYTIQKTILANENPSVGTHVWKDLIADKIYMNLTSTTSVRISLAQKIPFWTGKISEDSYTWIQYAATGAFFYFIKDIPCKYRIPHTENGSSCREFFGKEKFFRETVDVFIQALNDSSIIALENGITTKEEIYKLKAQYYREIAYALEKENMHDLSKKLIELSKG